MKEKKSIQESIEEKREDTWTERLNAFFHRISFLELSNQKKEKASLEVLENIGGTKLYWTEVVLSSLIATLGLLLNSVAVIIGAMLIAPFLNPIRSMAFAIATGHSKIFWKSGKILFFSIVLAVFLGTIISLIIPLRFETSEILARTSPNILDLLIAAASGSIVFLSLRYEQLSDSIVGVAMASALMPPLAVIGIEISLWNLDKASGSFLLFITNLFAIVLVGAIMFLFYGFSPHQKSSQSKTIKSLVLLLISVFLITIPLLTALTEISQKVKIQRAAQKTLHTALKNQVPSAVLSQLELKQYEKNLAHFSGTIKLPEGEVFYEDVKNELQQTLSKDLKKEVQFDLEIIRTASLLVERQQEMISPKELLENTFRKILSENNPELILLKLELGKIIENGADEWAIKTIFSLPTGKYMEEERQKEIEKTVQKEFENIKISFFWTHIAQSEGKPKEKKVEKESPEDVFHQKISLKWEKFFAENLPEGTKIENFTLHWKLKENISEKIANPYRGLLSLGGANILSNNFESEEESHPIKDEAKIDSKNSSEDKQVLAQFQKIETESEDEYLHSQKILVNEKEAKEISRFHPENIEEIFVSFDVYYPKDNLAHRKLLEIKIRDFTKEFEDFLVKVEWRFFSYRQMGI